MYSDAPQHIEPLILIDPVVCRCSFEMRIFLTTSERKGAEKRGCTLWQQMGNTKPLTGGLSGLLAAI